LTALTWTFGEVESALSAMHRIASDRRTAFQARLKNFHRLGFPPSLQSLKGRPTTYEPEQVFMMAVVLELSQFGVGPERAARLTIESEERLAEGVFMALDPDSADTTVWCSLTANALDDLMSGDQRDHHMHCMVLHRLLVSISSQHKRIGRIACFSISGLIEQLVDYLAKKHGPTFLEQLGVWARAASHADNKAEFWAAIKAERLDADPEA